MFSDWLKKEWVVNQLVGFPLGTIGRFYASYYQKHQLKAHFIVVFIMWGKNVIFIHSLYFSHSGWQIKNRKERAGSFISSFSVSQNLRAFLLTVWSLHSCLSRSDFSLISGLKTH